MLVRNFVLFSDPSSFCWISATTFVFEPLTPSFSYNFRLASRIECRSVLPKVCQSPASICNVNPLWQYSPSEFSQVRERICSRI
jgi:hypothetical protein